VIVAVIAVLAAVLMPVFARARARAWQTLCAQNLAQIGRAGMLYLQDHDECFPACYWIPAPPYTIDPRTSLQPYLKSYAVLYCPERRTVHQDCLDPMAEYRPNSRCMGYGYNWGSGLGWGTAVGKRDGLIRQDAGIGSTSRGVTLAEVALPSHCFFYGDTNDDYFLTLLREAMPGARRSDDPTARTNPLGSPYEPPRHNGGNNFVFVDGHVQWLPFAGGLMDDGGPRVVPDMSMYSRTGRWERDPIP
jgi:prepilin-type processing-associated H-X9-DG protein